MRTRTAASLGDRYWRLWSAATVSNLGDGVSAVAIPLVAVSLTRNPTEVAVVGFCLALPWLLIALPAGAIVDRSDRRRLVVVGNLLRGLVLGGLAVAIAADVATIPLLGGVALLLGSGEVVVDTSMRALLPRLVEREQLELANARLSSSEVVTNRFLGQPLGGFLFSVAPWVPPMLDGISFAVSGGIVGTIAVETPSERAAPTTRVRDELATGLRFLWGHEVLRPLVGVVAALAFANSATTAMFVLFATERLDLSPVGVGVFLAVEAVAAFVASLAVAPLVRAHGHSRSLVLGITLFAAGPLVIAATTNPAIAAIGVIALGVSGPFWNVVSETLRQRLIPNELYGRVASAYLCVAWSSVPVGAIVGGVVADGFGLPAVFVLHSAIGAATAVFGRRLFTVVRSAAS